MTAPLLTVAGLGVVAAAGAERELLQDVGFTVARGESLGLVGSSGAGKSTLGHALLGILPSGGRFAAGGRVHLGDVDLVALDPRGIREVRGRRIALVPQEPLLALNPVVRIGTQVAEAFVTHGLGSAAEARARVIETFASVGIPSPRNAVDRFPHEFSGGMRQRALIAAALVLEPELIIADEPTTALDATVQAQVLDLLEDVRLRTGSALLLISHDLDVVGERCARTIVLDGGRVVESGDTAELLRAPQSEAGRRLLAARRQSRTRAASAHATVAAPLIEAIGLEVTYAERRTARSDTAGRPAVADVSLSIGRGAAVGLVGESGCGKSSLARALLRLGPHSAGSVRFDGADLAAMDADALRRLRRRAQYIPQDAGASLTPHLRVDALVREGLEVHGLAAGDAAQRRAGALLERLGLPPRAVDALPDALSSGERQRVAIARALAVEPDLLVCDEPVASVDAVTRLALLDLLAELRRERGLALLVISHDLDAVRRLADAVVVMYLGRVVERGPVGILAGAARMPYTQALVAAEPTGDAAALARRPRLVGEASLEAAAAPGCPFHSRCPHPEKDLTCRNEPPILRPLPDGHLVACWKA